MSKRDGTMYMAMSLNTNAETSLGQDLNVSNDTVAGIIWVYWTKTAARKVHGRKIELRAISMLNI